MTPQIIRRMSAGRHTLYVKGQTHRPIDLSRFFTVTRDTQGIRADRAGEFQRSIVNPVKELMFPG